MKITRAWTCWWSISRSRSMPSRKSREQRSLQDRHNAAILLLFPRLITADAAAASLSETLSHSAPLLKHRRCVLHQPWASSHGLMVRLLVTRSRFRAKEPHSYIFNSLPHFTICYYGLSTLWMVGHKKCVCPQYRCGSI